ncbi:MAG TPA: DNA modification methylase [Lentisphaeria bacterium]|nr:DNA modification methylase [Lentisphaeria bacterium]
MQICNMKITDIIPYDKNPRLNDGAVEAVANSIKEFGWRAPIVVDKDMVIICGHTRLKAAIQLGLEEVPVHIADNLTPEQVQAYRIADNRTGEIAEWDYSLLPVELKELQDSDFDLSLLGFDADELDKLLNGEEENVVAEGETDADAVPEVPEVAVSKRGEVYQLGKHRLMCGDSTKPEDVAKLLDGELADMVFTDPPYGVSYKGVNNPGGRAWEVIENDDLRGDTLSEFLLAAFKNIKAHLREKRAFYIWYATSNHLQFEHAIIDAGLKSKQVLMWNKGMILGHSDYHWAFEPCFYGCKADENCIWFGDRCQTTVWDIKRDNTREYVHPTQKPTALAIKAMFNSCKPGEIVLDLFGGSGSTLIACEQSNRVNRSMEFDPKYADVIRKRWAEFVHGEGCDWQALTPAIAENENTAESPAEPQSGNQD